MKRTVVCIVIAMPIFFYGVCRYSQFEVDKKYGRLVEMREYEHEIDELSNMPDSINTKTRHLTSRCSPRKHFAYVKTHKSGSSTVRDIFARYARKHELRKAVSLPNPYVGGYPGRFNARFLYRVTSNRLTSYNVTDGPFVLMDHYRFNASALREIMPTDTLFVSVVREPWQQFQSSFHYYYRTENSITLPGNVNCFSDPYYQIAKGQKLNVTDYLNLAAENLNESVPWYFRSLNYQAHDLGLDPTLNDDDEIAEEVGKLGSEIDFMMITDYMDESMILLKEMFCMDWGDIVYLNKMTNSRRQSVPDDYTSAPEKFREMYKLDIALYRHFNASLWRKVDEYGRERMSNDVEKLQGLRDELLLQQISKGRKRRAKRTRRSLTGATEPSNRNIVGKLYTSILRDKLSNLYPLMTSDQAEELAIYMVDNHGGCPN